MVAGRRPVTPGGLSMLQATVNAVDAFSVARGAPLQILVLTLRESRKAGRTVAPDQLGHALPEVLWHLT